MLTQLSSGMVHMTVLNERFGEDRAHGIGKARQAVRVGDGNLLHATGLKFNLDKFTKNLRIFGKVSQYNTRRTFALGREVSRNRRRVEGLGQEIIENAQADLIQGKTQLRGADLK